MLKSLHACKVALNGLGQVYPVFRNSMAQGYIHNMEALYLFCAAQKESSTTTNTSRRTRSASAPMKFRMNAIALNVATAAVPTFFTNIFVLN